jgi:hypothetical protein
LYPAQRGTERTQENSRKISTHARFNKLLLFREIGYARKKL